MGTSFLRGGKATSLQKELSYTSSRPVELHAWRSAKFPCIEILKYCLLYGYRVFPGGKVRPGRAADRSHTSSAAVME